MTLTELQQTVYDSLKLSTSPDTAVVNRINRYLNQAYRQVLSRKGIGPKVRRSLLTASTVANSPFLVLPRAVVGIFQITDRSNDTPLEEMTLEELRYRDPGLKSTSSHPRAYVVMDYAAAVAQDPSSLGQVQVVSDNPADAGSDVRLQYVDVSGNLVLKTATLTGTTPANVSAVIVSVQKFYLIGTKVGNISLTDVAANTMATIGIGQLFSRYTRLHLFPKPTAVVSLTLDVELRVSDLANANDEPLLPEDFHDVLISGTLYREYKIREKISLYKAEWNEWNEFNQRIAELRTFLNRPSGVVYNSNRPRRFSQLGPNFSAGS